jgi:hypothetical protein
MENLLKHRLERAEPRFAANIEAVIFCDGFATPATIKNISAHGFLLECRHVPQIDSRVSIITDRAEMDAIVIWTGDDRYGVQLSSPIDPADFTTVDELNVGWT